MAAASSVFKRQRETGGGMWGSGGGSGRKNPGSCETHVDSQDGAASVLLQKPITAAVWKKLKNLSHQKAEDACVSSFSDSFQYVRFYFQHCSGLSPYDANRSRPRTKGCKRAEAMCGRRL
jgi:hypothetical protein